METHSINRSFGVICFETERKFKASDETKKVGGGELRWQKFATAKDDELPFKGIICKKWGGGP